MTRHIGARAAPLLLGVVSVYVYGCRMFAAGLPPGDSGVVSPEPGDVGAGVLDVERAGTDASAPASDVRPPPPLDRPAAVEPPPTAGPPRIVGCADGTREGFVPLAAWPDIAGCSGAWSVPGLLGAAVRLPQCGRGAGNTAERPTGAGCTVTDLCAEGWHVCGDAGEVDRKSASDCESAVPGPEPRFFLVMAGASPQGVCYSDPAAANDLNGCGTLGQPAAVDCHPLDRRMGFADCLLTGGVWSCGTAADHQREAAVVTKRDSTLGGVLCCAD